MPAGAIILDGQWLELAPGQSGGFEWSPTVSATLPGAPSPEEAEVSRAPGAIRRTWPWLDWSGGLGAAIQSPGEHRLHYSEGPSGANPRRLVRGHEIRTVVPANATGTVSHFREIKGALYAVIGDTVRLVTLTLNAETVAARIGLSGVANGTANGLWLTGTTFTVGSPLWYDGAGTKAYFGTTLVANRIVSFDGTSTWAQAAGALQVVSNGYWALSQATDGQRLWGASCPDDTTGIYTWNLAQGQDPFVFANWSSKFPLANRLAGITGMAALRDGVIVTAADGMIWRFDFASGLPVPLLDSDGLVPSVTSGLQMGVWNGMLVVPTVRGLLLFDESGPGPGTFKAIGPESMYGHEMPVRGQCTATYRGDPAYLWASFYNGTDSYIWCGRLPFPHEVTTYTYQGTGARNIIWDTGGVGLVANTKVTSLHISNIGTNPVLCIGTSVPDVRFVTLPRYQQSVFSDANLRSSITTSNCFLPDADGGAPTTYKAFRRLRFKTIGFSTAEKVTVSTRVDRGNYSQVGIVQDVPIAVINLPTGTEGMSMGIQLGWSGTTAAANFPQILAVELDFTERPETSTYIDVGIYVSRDQQTGTGTQPLTGETLRAELERLAGQVRYVEVKGPDDVVLQVAVDPFQGVKSEFVEALPGKGRGWLVRFRLNVYDEMLSFTGLVWGQGSWTGGAKVGKWG